MEKTHKEKMLAGELYRGGDPELVAAQVSAQVKLEAFNGSTAADPAKRRLLLLELFREYGEDCYIRPPFHCDYGSNISIGRGTFVNFGCVFLDCNEIRIGQDVQIAPGVHIYTATHPLDPTIRRSGLESAHPVVIGDNVWLGGGAIICPGVTIGDNTVVGAGSVVTRSLPANVFAAGNPARVIKPLEAQA